MTGRDGCFTEHGDLLISDSSAVRHQKNEDPKKNGVATSMQVWHRVHLADAKFDVERCGHMVTWSLRMLPELLVQFGDGSSHVPCFAEIIAENSWQISSSSRFQRAHRTRPASGELHIIALQQCVDHMDADAFGDKLHVASWNNLALMFGNSTFGFQSSMNHPQQPDASYRKRGITAYVRTRAASAPCDVPSQLTSTTTGRNIWILCGFFRGLCNVMSEQDYGVVNVDTNQWCDKERCEREKKRDCIRATAPWSSMKPQSTHRAEIIL